MARQRQAMIIYLTVVCGIFAGVLVPSANGQPQKESPSGGLKLLEYFLAGPMAEVDEIIFGGRCGISPPQAAIMINNVFDIDVTARDDSRVKW